MSTTDAIDVIQAEWAALRPEDDLEVIGIVGRVLRGSALIVRGSDEALAAHSLTRGEFDVLTALRRSPSPRSPGELRTVSLATGPATTKRLHALEARGLVERSANPDDRRGALISLTEAGIVFVDELFPEQLATERALVAGIPEADRAEVIRALRLLLTSVERATSER